MIYRFFEVFYIWTPFFGGADLHGIHPEGFLFAHPGVLPYSPSIAFTEADVRFPIFSS